MIRGATKISFIELIIPSAAASENTYNKDFSPLNTTIGLLTPHKFLGQFFVLSNKMQFEKKKSHVEIESLMRESYLKKKEYETPYVITRLIESLPESFYKNYLKIVNAYKTKNFSLGERIILQLSKLDPIKFFTNSTNEIAVSDLLVNKGKYLSTLCEYQKIILNSDINPNKGPSIMLSFLVKRLLSVEDGNNFFSCIGQNFDEETILNQLKTFQWGRESYLFWAYELRHFFNENDFFQKTNQYLKISHWYDDFENNGWIFQFYMPHSEDERKIIKDKVFDLIKKKDLISKLLAMRLLESEIVRGFLKNADFQIPNKRSLLKEIISDSKFCQLGIYELIKIGDENPDYLKQLVKCQN